MKTVPSGADPRREPVTCRFAAGRVLRQNSVPIHTTTT